MANERILAVGSISGGNVQLRVAPLAQNDSLVLAAIDFGRHLFAIGARLSDCRNQHEEAGYIEAELEAAALGQPLPNGMLQLMIDVAAELQELMDAMEDRDFWRSGAW